MGRLCRKVLWVGNAPLTLNPVRDIAFSCTTLANNGSAFIKYSRNEVLIQSQPPLVELPIMERALQKYFKDHWLPRVSALLSNDELPRFSETATSILVGPWLMFLIQTCWLNFYVLRQHIDTHGADRLDVVIPSGPPFSSPPRCSIDLVGMLIQPEFHAWIVSRFLEILCPPNWRMVAYQPKQFDPSGDGFSHQRNVEKDIIGKTRKWLKELRCSSEEFSLPWKLAFSFLLAVRQVAPKSRTLLVPTDNSHQKFITKEFRETVVSIVERCMPTFFRVNFDERVMLAIKKGNYRRGFGRIVSSHIFDDETNLNKALAFDAGEVVFSVQHGGGYGTHKVFPLSPESEYLGGPFITWGWRDHESYEVNGLPLPSPGLSRLRAVRCRTKHGRDIVFVGGDMNPAVFRLHSKPVGEQWLDYREEKVAFLSELSEKVFDTVVYRGYMNVSGVLSEEEFLLELFPRLRLLTGDFRLLNRRMSAARACVVDHPITTLHQIMAMNVPTIAYWNHEHWGISAQATPFFAELEDAGILHRSGKEAGGFVEKNFDRIETWWTNGKVQAARNRWCNEYARTSRHWVKEWMNALWRNPPTRGLPPQ